MNAPSRTETPTPAAAGIVFPAVDGGSRSTTTAGAAIIAAALSPLGAGWAEVALGEPHWRRTYPKYFGQLVEGALVDAETALASARCGLDAAWQTLRWAEGDSEPPLEAALALALAPTESAGTRPLQTQTVRGRGDVAPAPWGVPYRGEILRGDALRRRIDTWATEGIIEPSAAAALHRCSTRPEWFDLADRMMVLLGAGSEAGPLRWLARWRARLVAVDIDRPATWQRIASVVDAGNATLHVPLHGSAGSGEWTTFAGADMLTRAPDIARWVRRFDGPLDIAAHAYLDGERHVRVALAMDLIQRAVCHDRADTTLAFMATPTDVFAVPAATARASMTTYRERPMMSRGLQRPLRLATGDRFFQPNVTRLVRSRQGTDYGVVDSLVIEQGPNYALAKRLQQWRAVLARAAGHRVSLNIAPSTTTASVVKNPALAAGFAGADTFGIEVFEPETTNALMAALWVHDLRCDESAANPARRLAHPFELFIDNACHGGLWRTGYRPRSALPFAAALGWVRSRASLG